MSLLQNSIKFFVSALITSPLVFGETTKQSHKCISFYTKSASKKKSPKVVKLESDTLVVSKLNETDFYRLAKYSSDQTYPSFLKFAVRVEENGKLGEVYFFDTNKYPFHALFLIERFFPQADTNAIDKITLNAKGRKFLLGTVLLKNNEGDYSKPQEYHVDWVNDGVMPASDVIEAMKLLVSSTQGLNDIRLIVPRKATEEYTRQADLFKSAKVNLSFPEVSKSQVEVYSSNWSVGRIKILSPAEFSAAVAQKTISSSDILILDEAPRELPQVSGVIVKEPTTPSSHIALLSQMYQIPFAYQKDASLKYAHLDGQNVYFSAEKHSEAQTQKIEIQPIKDSDENSLRKLKSPSKLGSPAIDLTESRIVPVSSLTADSVAAYGAKSVGLGLIQRVLPNNSAEIALGLPIYYYRQFLAEARVGTTTESLASFIQQRIARLETASSSDTSILLKSIREAILAAKIPEPILATIVKNLKHNFPGVEKIKFRSSSNVEDLKGFNGAGLYDSKGGSISDPESISKAIKTVWSSVFNERAYLARKQFGIVEASVGMAILMQKSFKGELANGVAILKLDSNKDFLSEITGFPGEDLEVTAAPLGVVPETMLVQKAYDPSEPYRLEIKTKSTEVPEGRTLLLEDEYRQLTTLMQTLMAAWPKNQKPEDGLDFEWKVVSENGRRKLYFKQARPVPERIGFPEKTVTVLGGSYKMELAQPENPEGLLVYQLPKRLHLEINTISLEDLKTPGSVLVKSIKSESNAGIVDLKILGTRYNLEDYESGTSQKGRKLTVQIKVNHPILGETFISCDFIFSVDAAGKTAQPILNPSQYRYFIDFSAAKWPQKFGSNTRFQAGYSVKDDQVVTPQSELQKLVSSDGKFEFTFSEDTLLINGGTLQKTMFKNVTGVNVVTKDAGIFSVDKNGLLYAPAHHNFAWSYVIDLNFTKGTTAQIEKIKKQFGRFIVISKITDAQTTATFYSEAGDGRAKIIDEIEMK
tara:strand:- start:9246 stop:12194 length:2949 start_codon:yes stop_codon:yes gene_type:complete